MPRQWEPKDAPQAGDIRNGMGRPSPGDARNGYGRPSPEAEAGERNGYGRPQSAMGRWGG